MTRLNVEYDASESDAPMSSDDARERGNALYAERAYDAALAAYDDAIALSHDGDAKARANKAAVLMALRRWSEASAECVKALAIDGAYDRARRRLEACMVKAGTFDDAIASAEGGGEASAALAGRLKRLRDARARGNDMFKAGDKAGAEAAYGAVLRDDALRATPGAAIVFCNRAACRSGLGDHEGALADADAALARDETYQKARLRRATALAALTRYDEANEEFTRLFDELPGDVSVATNVNACRAALGKPADVKAGVKTIEDMKTYMTLVNTKPLVVVDFTATWCGPCKMIAPVFATLSTKFPSIYFLKVDVDANQDISGYERVSSMPTFAVYRYGKKVESFSGADGNKLTALCTKWIATV